jgi:hypothetical protein
MSDEPLVIDEENLVRFTREQKEMVGAIERDILLRPPSVNNFGIFTLLKSELVIKGKTVTADRCDVLTYSAVSLYNESPELQSESLILGKNVPYSEDRIFGLENIRKHVAFLEIPGKLCLSYLEFCEVDENGKVVSSSYLERGPWSGSLRTFHTMGEFLKSMREWSFMLDAPFYLTEHPMAIWSKMFFDELNPPDEILNEIDSYPDMYLAKYLKGDENHREINGDFPEMSAAMKNWIVEIVEQNPKKKNIELIKNL